MCCWNFYFKHNLIDTIKLDEFFVFPSQFLSITATGVDTTNLQSLVMRTATVPLTGLLMVVPPEPSLPFIFIGLFLCLFLLFSHHNSNIIGNSVDSVVLGNWNPGAQDGRWRWINLSYGGSQVSSFIFSTNKP